MSAIVTHRARIFELAPLGAVRAIIRSDTREFGEADGADPELNYYVGINTWLNIINEWCGPVYQVVLDELVSSGLCAVIQQFVTGADQLVHGVEITSPLVNEVLNRLHVYPNNSPWLIGLENPVLSAKLEICRYLKRIDAPFALKKQTAIDQFLVTQMDVYNSWHLPEGWLDKPRTLTVVWAAYELSKVDWEPFLSVFRRVTSTTRAFTHGAASETGRSFGKKLCYMHDLHPEFFRPIFGSYGESIPLPSAPISDSHLCMTLKDRPSWLSPLTDTHIVTVSTAPKANKGPRIIATEPLEFQTITKWLQVRIYDLQRRIPGADLTDQTLNQDLAVTGSRDGSYATIDLSAASDYVSKELVDAIFPFAVSSELKKYSPDFFRFRMFDGSTALYPLASYATMGHGLTFWVESMTFWAIARGTVRSLGGNPDHVSVYGDDIIVPGPFYGAVVHALESCGFKVNREKSFGSGPYRESCGVEAVNGNVIPSVYYPRFPIEGEITEHTVSLSERSSLLYDESRADSVSRLIQLQHRLYPLSIRAARFIDGVVLDYLPEMTYSQAGDDLAPDLWAPQSRYSVLPDLYGEVRFVGFRDRRGKFHRVQQDPQTDSFRAHCLEGGLSHSDAALNYRPWVTPLFSAPIAESGRQVPAWCAPKVRYKGKVSSVERALYESYSYWEFLEKGPSPLYADDTAHPHGYVPGYDMTMARPSAEQMLLPAVTKYKLQRKL